METDLQQQFLTRLQSIVADRGNRAALRRYWSPTTRHQAYPLLGQLGALSDDRKTILAALYAEQPEHKTGQSVGKAALRLGDRKDGEHPYDRHFRRLLACDSLDDLAQQLHRLVKRLQREGIGLDYAELLKNLNFWANYSEDVKVRWAADFWQAPVEQINTESAEV
jgi:CRISPR type I-E-associated protein CasB/Cse2